MEKDLTQGNTLKLIIQFCIPLIGGALFQQFYNIVDTMIVGQFVGVDALAAVGATGSLNFLVIGFAQGLASGFWYSNFPSIWSKKAAFNVKYYY